MRLRRKLFQHGQSPIQIQWIVSSALFFGILALFILVRVHAQTFLVPSASPPDNGKDLNTLVFGTDFIKLSNTVAQTVNSSLYVASSTASTLSSAIIGDYPNSTSLTAYTGSMTGPAFLPPALPSIVSAAGIYGYAKLDGAGNYAIGAYGSAEGGTSPVGIVGKTINPSVNIRSIDGNGSDGSKGRDSEMAIGSDGLLVVSEYTGSKLRVVHCTTPDCSSSPAVDVDSSSSIGRYNSIAIGMDGYPIISYWDATSPGLKVVHCTNYDCSSKDVQRVLDPGTVGKYTSIAIGMDGNPAISYYDEGNNKLKFIHCTDYKCANAVTPITPDGAYTGGRYTSILIGTDGNPIIAHGDGSQLKITLCTKQDCSTSTTMTFGAAYASEDIDMKLVKLADTTWAPVIVYNDGKKVNVGDSTNQGTVYVVGCTDSACTGITATNRISYYADEPGMTIGFDGNPYISYVDNSDKANCPNGILAASTNCPVRVVHCANIQCSSFDLNFAITLENSRIYDPDTAMLMSSAGYPMIAYRMRSTTASDFMLRLAQVTSGRAAKFLGPVSVLSNGGTDGGASGIVHVGGRVSAGALDIKSTDAIGLSATNGIRMTGKFKNGIFGTTSSANANHHGLDAISESNYGLYALDQLFDNGSAQTSYGVYGSNLTPTGNAGVYGFSASGNGVEGLNGSLSTLASVEGKATLSTDIQAAVYGRGGAFAGLFEGNVNISNSGRLCIYQTCLTAANLQAMLAWYETNVGPLPDAYQ